VLKRHVNSKSKNAGYERLRNLDVTRIPDPYLLLAVVILVFLSLVIIYSASSARAFELTGDSTFYLSRQLIRVVIGFMGLIILTYFNYRHLRLFGLPLLVLAIGALVLLLLPGVVEPINGAKRAFSLAGQSFQPAEIAKFALLIFMADSVTRKGEDIKTWAGYLRRLLILGIVCGLIVSQPDLSTGVLIGIIGICIIYLGGTKLGYLFVTALVVVPIGAKLVTTSGYRIPRWNTFIAGLLHPDQYCYQVKQSLIGLGDGGIFGVGIGMSHQKNFFLPEPFTDFVFSILGEELGFIGTSAVVLLFFIIAVRGLRIAKRAPDDFGYVLAGGITFSILAYGFINLLVVTGLAPATGLPLPFLTYGGSSLIFTLFMIGILLNISRQSVDSEELEAAPRKKTKLKKKTRAKRN